MFQDVLHFVWPDFSDAFQTGFFIIILLSTALTLFGVGKYARESNWEANWEGAGRGTAGIALDVDHGSFNDVCDAVATRPEKYAEIVPGTLLVFGLLGTFVGLGIALDSASSILTNANAQGALDGAMNDLMPMMEGLGTKFKTSTWGILGFLVLKLALSAMGRETRRQQWVIARMKQEMDKTRLASSQLQDLRGQKLHAALSDVADRSDLSLGQRLQHDREARIAHTSATASAMQDVLATVSGTLGRQLLEALDKDRELRTAESDRRSAEVIAAISQGMQALQQRLGSDAKAHHEAAVRCGDLLEAMHGAQLVDTSVAKETHSALQTSIALQEDLVTGVKGQLEVTERVAASLKAIVRIQSDGNDIAADTRTTLQAFTDAQRQFSESIQSSADTMSAAASNMNGAADEMSAVISSFDGSVKSTLSSIETGLGSTIGSMDASLRQNLGTMGKLLEETSTALQSSLNDFSASTGETLGEVTSSIHNASVSQEKSMKSVRETSEDVQVLVNSNVNSIKDIGDTIVRGLSSVATCAREIQSLASQLGKSNEVASKAWSDTHAMLERTGTQGDNLRASIEDASQRFDVSQQHYLALAKRQAEALDGVRAQLEILCDQVVHSEAELVE